MCVPSQSLCIHDPALEEHHVGGTVVHDGMGKEQRHLLAMSVWTHLELNPTNPQFSKHLVFQYSLRSF